MKNFLNTLGRNISKFFDDTSKEPMLVFLCIFMSTIFSGAATGIDYQILYAEPPKSEKTESSSKEATITTTQTAETVETVLKECNNGELIYHLQDGKYALYKTNNNGNYWLIIDPSINPDNFCETALQLQKELQKEVVDAANNIKQ